MTVFDPTLQQMRFLDAVKKAEGNAAEAGRRCSVLASTINAGLRKLTSSLGDDRPLFYKVGTRNQLTAFGEMVATHAAEIIRCVDNLKADVESEAYKDAN